MKKVVRNFCLECGEPTIAVKYAKVKGSPYKGMMWRCKNDHVHRERKHFEEYDKTR